MVEDLPAVSRPSKHIAIRLLFLIILLCSLEAQLVSCIFPYDKGSELMNYIVQIYIQSSL